LKKEQFHLRLQTATGQAESSVRMKAARKDAARVLTILNEMAESAAAE
jgi:large subunit ribosomal protein L29